MKESLRSRLAAKARQSRFSKNRADLLEDENTTNSENSEGNNLFNEINWEENIEVDTSDLIDEFAPRPSTAKVRESKSEEEQKKMDEKADDKEKKEPRMDMDMMEQEFKPGLVIYVMDYKSSTWNQATIAEVDWDEDEVLVQYGDITRSEEWVAMSSQRLSTLVPGSSDIPILPVVTTQKSEIVIKPTKESQEAPFKRDHKKRNFRIMKSLSKKLLKKEPPRTEGEEPPSIPQPTVPEIRKKPDKFQVGEKVLAKWSEHRMQKFPAIIKTIAGKGNYDVLFYDGFEKTISEDHLYKTTEEECAKYRHSNPSEADSFVDMEEDSKEARRQRKKKTFDDYVFVKENIKLKPNRDRKKKGDRIRIKSHHSSKERRSHKKKPHPYLDPTTEAHPGPQDSPQSNQIEVQALVHEPPTEIQNISEEERWSGDIPENARPLSILTSHEGPAVKTVLIPDQLLPNGWVKHAIQLGQSWKSFLISPDKYKINTLDELKDYFMRMYKSGPRNLDFRFNDALLPELMEKQKDLEITTKVFHNWVVKKKPGRKPTPVKSQFPGTSGSSKVGKVRTLLPKYRFEPYPTPQEAKSDHWKCPKEGCDKKFRKESLLQMHIKHYHVEFESLVGPAPNVVDLALARSEFANSASPEAGPSKSPFHGKKGLLKSPPGHSSGYSDDLGIKSETEGQMSPQIGSTLVAFKQEKNASTPKRPGQTDEKKPTIKTMLPFRQSSSLDSSSRSHFETDDFESDEEKMFKPQPKPKKPRVHPLGIKSEAHREHIYPVAPGLRYLKKKPPLLEKLQVTTDSNDSYEEERTSPNAEISISEDGVVLERLKSEEIINCTCGFREEDGLMIQCDICMCWQHGLCNSIETDSEVPDQYVCYICRNPSKVRTSKKYSYALHYLSQGKLPSFNFRNKNERDVKEREVVVKKIYEISQKLHEIKNVDQSLRVKLNIAEQADHPKLYLWAKSWSETLDSNETKVKQESNPENDSQTEDKSPEKTNRIPIPPEAQIDSAECRLRLLEHVDDYLQHMDDRLTSLQTQIAALESQDADLSSNVSSDRVTKQTIKMLLRDLKSVQQLAAIS